MWVVQEARRTLAQVLDKQPDNAHALHTLGNLEILDGNHNAAGTLFRRGLQYRGELAVQATAVKVYPAA